MKIIVSTILLFFILNTAKSQFITYTQAVKHSECNGLNNGSVQINVTSTNGPYSFLWNNGATGNSISDLSPGNYSVTITDGSSNTTSAAVSINELACNFKAELIFTPNSDGINDTWEIEGLEDLQESLVVVYNRMGQKVFEKKGIYEPWDGKDLFGAPLPDATYFYIIYANKKNKKPAEQGSVSILR